MLQWAQRDQPVRRRVMGVRRWEKNQKNKFAKYFLIGVAVGLVLGLVTNKIGLFLPLGGIVGMCVGVTKKGN